mgnify:CR=1 FL=1
MILTGKAKEDFENYILNKELGHDSEVLISVYNQETLFINYNNVKETLLNALIIEWFDSVGIIITSDYFELNKGFYSEILESNFEIIKPTRQEALAEAIKKANEIYNNKN